MVIHGYLWLSDNPPLGMYFIADSEANYPNGEQPGSFIILDVETRHSIGHKLALSTKGIAAAIFPEEEIVEDSKNVE